MRLGEISGAYINQVARVGLHYWWALEGFEKFYEVQLGWLGIFHHQDQFHSLILVPLHSDDFHKTKLLMDIF